MLAVGGGDGTVACAAGIAVQAEVPLAVFPAVPSTTSPRTSAATAWRGQSVPFATVVRRYVDLVSLNEDDGQNTMVINTASIGAYPKYVRVREA